MLRAMESLTLPMKSLLDPVDAVPQAVSGRRWVVPLVLLMVSTSVAGAAIASRVDVAPRVIAGLQKEGDLQKKSEREIGEAVEQAQRVGLVLGVAQGVFLVPLLTLLGAIVLRVAAWLLGLKTSFGAMFSVMAVSQLPRVVFRILQTVVALKQEVIAEKHVANLLVTSVAQIVTEPGPHLKAALSTLDFFSVWVAISLGLGFSAATGISRSKGLLFGVCMYVLFAALFFIGIPGLMAGAEGAGAGGPR